MPKKILTLTLALASFSLLAATNPAHPHLTRAYTRQLQKCKNNYNSCMKKYCSDKNSKSCKKMNTHCVVEYKRYCVSEAAAIKPPAESKNND